MERQLNLNSLFLFVLDTIFVLLEPTGTATNKAAAEQSVPLTSHAQIQGNSKVTPLQSLEGEAEHEGAKTG